MSKKNVVLTVLLVLVFAAFVAAITALLLGHPDVFWVLRDLGLLAAIGAAWVTIDLFHKEAKDLQEKIEILTENAELNAEAFKEVSRDAREAWEEVERLRAELAKAEASAANGWKDAGDKFQQVTDLKAKVQDLEAWIASPPATPEDIIW